MQFTELELDALAETFNLSLGEAAAMFSEMVREDIIISVPTVEILSRAVLLEQLQHQGSERLCAIKQRFESSSDFNTNTLLLFPEQGTLELVRRMLGDSTPIEHITELEQDTLAEIGNIIMNGCMGSLANLFNNRMTGTLPDVSVSNTSDVLNNYDLNELFLVAKISMSLSSTNITGLVLFIMDVNSINKFLGEVRKAFQIKGE
jgi:chemotaxis protein CheC